MEELDYRVSAIKENAQNIIRQNFWGCNTGVKILVSKTQLFNVLVKGQNSRRICIKIKFSECNNSKGPTLKNRYVILCAFDQVAEEASNGDRNFLWRRCFRQVSGNIENFLVNHIANNQIEEKSNPILRINIMSWKSHIIDWYSEIIEALNREFPHAINAENFSKCALQSWNYSSDEIEEIWSDRYGLTHRNTINNDRDRVLFRTVAAAIYRSNTAQSFT